MLRVQSIYFQYADKQAISNITFSVKKGESVALIGESGSGKSTLLKLIYGLHDLNKGNIFWKDYKVLGPAFHLVPGMEFMKYLAQDFDLMPWVSVAENVGRFLSNFYLKEKENRINELLQLVSMKEYANTKAKFLSGGQLQRVALAKALAEKPEVLLLDEPFSHIDFFQKKTLAQHIFKYCKKHNITVIYTSHNPEEILSYSDRVLVLQKGKLVANDIPQHIYQLPSNQYIAQLTGDVNIVPVSYLGVQNQELLLLRPHQLEVSTQGYKAEVIDCYYIGKTYLVKILFVDKILTMESKEPLKGTIHFKIK